MRRISTKVPDWALGFALTLFVLAAYLFAWYPLELIEYVTYDLRAGYRQKSVNAPIVVVAIDEESIRKLGRWPWSRAYVAGALDILSEYGAKVVGMSIIYSEPDVNDGLAAIKKIKATLDKEPELLKNPKVVVLYETLERYEEELDTDTLLASTLKKSGNIVLPANFSIGEPLDEGKTTMPEYLKRISKAAPFKNTYIGAWSALLPIPLFAQNAASIGHINIVPDKDGVVRSEALLIYYRGRLFPSFALQTYLKYRDCDAGKLDVSGGISVCGKTVPSGAKNEMLISYNLKKDAVAHYSFFDLVNEKVPAERFKDKIVLIGATTATGIATLSSTPVGSAVPGVEITANVLENLINGDSVTRPAWALYVEVAAIILFGVFLSLLITRLKAGLSAAFSLSLIILYNAAAVYLFVSHGIWLKMFHPTALLLFGYIVVVSKRYLLTEKKTEMMEADGIETNKMLGLSFQGQGMLDLAFEKFRKCPLDDDSIKDLLYNLGLDFERKRMINKAVAVYEHVLTDGPYKDLDEKARRLKSAGETVMLGLGGPKKDSTMMLDGADAKPTLGRYEIIRELGRGAMGIVYLGRDPRINREVAIKTLRFEEIDESIIDEVKRRFFLEAESAGKLTHPGIIKVYDVGDDHDLAYMAMELIDGGDLASYCTKESRMPFGQVLKIVSMVADALDYAHAAGVVHRDIKPANIMLLKNKEVRVADFGIARVVESSKTQTGVVMGTPSYMSPEQISGKKVDGRSDLFSLGVVFFELLAGEKPFKGDNITTLMYNITTGTRSKVREAEPRIPQCVAQVIDRMIETDLEKRSRRGRDIVDDINRCIKILTQKTRTAPQSKPA